MCILTDTSACTVGTGAFSQQGLANIWSADHRLGNVSSYFHSHVKTALAVVPCIETSLAVRQLF